METSEIIRMLSKPVKQIIVAAGKSDGVPLARISAAIALMDNSQPDRAPDHSLLVNQATAAKLLAVSRFTIRRMVADGVLHPIKVRQANRYSRAELESIARRCPIPISTIPDSLTPPTPRSRIPAMQ